MMLEEARALFGPFLHQKVRVKGSENADRWRHYFIPIRVQVGWDNEIWVTVLWRLISSDSQEQWMQADVPSDDYIWEGIPLPA